MNGVLAGLEENGRNKVRKENNMREESKVHIPCYIQDLAEADGGGGVWFPFLSGQDVCEDQDSKGPMVSWWVSGDCGGGSHLGKACFFPSIRPTAPL